MRRIVSVRMNEYEVSHVRELAAKEARHLSEYIRELLRREIEKQISGQKAEEKSA